MGRVKVPRCDNCGAPVEFVLGAIEARCEYCDEVLIRELPPSPPSAPAQRRAPVPNTVATRKVTIWPFLVVGVAMFVVASASSIANFVASVRTLPDPAPDPDVGVASRARGEREPSSAPESPGDEAKEPSKPTAAPTRAQRLPRPRASATPTAAAPIATVPVEPPKPPKFDTQAAIAGLDAAKLKAEASCKSASGVRLFVNMGFDPDGVNRGASVSDAKLRGTPEAECALRIFRGVRIPPFDPATRPSGLGRPVRL